MDVLPVILVLAAVVGVAVLVAWPLLTGDEGGAREEAAAGGDARAEVEEDLHRSLQAIREIAFDRASGHLSDEDFRALDADERARAVDLLRRRDALSADDGGDPEETSPPLRSSPADVDADGSGGRL
ncbi:MAG TPA: hypothetical protein VNT51_11500 [Miltoncostaeaceae bacterium]|nr:hypothetical protein [Miltoncostaeaceae bacterium]